MKENRKCKVCNKEPQHGEDTVLIISNIFGGFGPNRLQVNIKNCGVPRIYHRDCYLHIAGSEYYPGPPLQPAH